MAHNSKPASPHAAHHEPDPDLVPQVTGSQSWGVIAIIIVIITIALITTALWSKFSAKTYSMQDVQYGQVLTITIKPNKRVIVDVTPRDWCPFYSNGTLHVYDSNDNERTLEGDSFTSGRAVSKGSFTYVFKNKQKKSITLKVGRCRSQQKCNIQF
ncbi:MAG: hypothetical protein V4665_00855 [Patescibacteria group bacterium]